MMMPSTRTGVLALCQKTDPNGCYTDKRGAAEGFEPVSHLDALLSLATLYHPDNVGNDGVALAVYMQALAAIGGEF